MISYLKIPILFQKPFKNFYFREENEELSVGKSRCLNYIINS